MSTTLDRLKQQQAKLRKQQAALATKIAKLERKAIREEKREEKKEWEPSADWNEMTDEDFTLLGSLDESRREYDAWRAKHPIFDKGNYVIHTKI